MLKQQLDLAAKQSRTAKRKQQTKNKEYATYYCYVSLFILALFGNAPLASCLFLTLIIVIGHAVLRKRNIKSNAVHFMDVYKDFGPISSLSDYISSFIDDDTPK